MSITKVPDFKLSNVINNILIYSKLTHENNVLFSTEDRIYKTIETIVNDIKKNPLILNYFNYSKTEHSLIEDTILNGLEYPGVYEDFIDELVRKNKNSLNNELSIFITFSLINKNKNINQLFNQVIINARKSYTQVKFNK